MSTIYSISNYQTTEILHELQDWCNGHRSGNANPAAVYVILLPNSLCIRLPRWRLRHMFSSLDQRGANLAV